MIPRPVLTVLVYAFFLLTVAFGVLAGGYALASATQDTLGAAVIRYVAMGCLMLLAVDVVLLLGALGVDALLRSEDRHDDPPS